MDAVERTVRERLKYHRENLPMWQEPDGYLLPTEPDPEERERVRHDLGVAINELERVLEDSGANSRSFEHNSHDNPDSIQLNLTTEWGSRLGVILDRLQQEGWMLHVSFGLGLWVAELQGPDGSVDDIGTSLPAALLALAERIRR